ncbi:hypothetical protein E2C01_058720 [Portunus trituberculatus]|uniref:Uncharacterized protein n=1 Tax=Portunus trituberculatus TaxID=210409 RepID=A0A5B7H3H3_PORTR|nr:hypothetical protein [Portunus trituberculatus]
MRKRKKLSVRGSTSLCSGCVAARACSAGYARNVLREGVRSCGTPKGSPCGVCRCAGVQDWARTRERVVATDGWQLLAAAAAALPLTAASSSIDPALSGYLLPLNHLWPAAAPPTCASCQVERGQGRVRRESDPAAGDSWASTVPPRSFLPGVCWCPCVRVSVLCPLVAQCPEPPPGHRPCSHQLSQRPLGLCSPPPSIGWRQEAAGRRPVAHPMPSPAAEDARTGQVAEDSSGPQGQQVRHRVPGRRYGHLVWRGSAGSWRVGRASSPPTTTTTTTMMTASRRTHQRSYSDDLTSAATPTSAEAPLSPPFSPATFQSSPPPSPATLQAREGAVVGVVRDSEGVRC